MGGRVISPIIPVLGHFFSKNAQKSPKNLVAILGIFRAPATDDVISTAAPSPQSLDFASAVTALVSTQKMSKLAKSRK